MGTRFSHLSWNDRLTIERMLQKNYPVKTIAEAIGFSRKTVYTEIERGQYIHRNSDWTEEKRYSPDIAQKRYKTMLKEKGRGLKIGSNLEFVRYIEKKIIEEKKSPQAALYDAKKEEVPFLVDISLSSLYNYIRRGDVFENLTIADCPLPRREKVGKARRVQARAAKGTSIEKRPQEINDCLWIGHWEGDTVVGPPGEGKASLLCFTERHSLLEVLELLPDHTSASVVKALNRVERRFGEKAFRVEWRSITCDNGSELLDYEGIEASRRNKKKRTKLYRCHPYSSYERGKNENNNRMIRRWFPKGTNFDKITKKQVKQVEEWLNNYPRPQFGGRSSKEVYAAALLAGPPEGVTV